MRSNFTRFLFLFILFCSFELEAQVVNKSTDNGQNGTLRREIQDAAPGATITFSNSITTVTLASEIVIDKNLTIVGDSNNLTIIDAAGNGRVFTITSGNVTLRNLTITNGIASNGGGIYATNANLTVNNCDISSNTANGANGAGGGVYLDTGATMSITNSVVSGNTANASGGGLRNAGGTMGINSTNIVGNTASGNSANMGGGGIFNAGGVLNITSNSVIANNIANGTSGSGGGIFNDTNGTLIILNSSVEENFASRAGGGIEDNSGTAHTTLLQNVTITSNTTGNAPGNGGGLHVTGNGTVNFNAGTVSNNTAASEGGGLWNGSGAMTINGTVINANTASGAASDNGGGGIFNAGGNVTIQNGVVITNNVADGTEGSGGGIFNDMGNLTVNNAQIRSNSAVRAGAGIEVNASEFSTTNLVSVQFQSNGLTSPPNFGGAVHITGEGITNITSCFFLGNLAKIKGGGVFNGSGTMTISDTDIVNNKSQGAAVDEGGGGIYNDGGNLTINTNTIINTNIVDGTQGSGGGIFNNAGTLIIENSDVKSNTANGVGAGIENYTIGGGSLRITSCEIAENVLSGTTGLGGGIHVNGSGATTIDTSILSANEASVSGGAIYNDAGNLTITESSINYNVVSGTGATSGGAGVFNANGLLNVSQTTFRNNSAGGNGAVGGGIHNGNGGTLTILRSTIGKNTANGKGGGIYNNNSATVNAVTIAENTAGSGGGIFGDKAISIKNTIVANNTSANGADVAGTITSGGYNLVENDGLSVFTALANDIEGKDPLLGTLQNNGGTALPNGSPTFTYELLDGSPAFDAGSPADTFTDQIGQAIFGAARDIGSFEAQSTLGLEDLEKLWSTRIFPNPSNGEFTIRLGSDVVSDLSVTMYSITGQKLLQRDLDYGDNNFQLKNVNPGMYVLSLSDGVNKKSFKLVIQ